MPNVTLSGCVWCGAEHPPRGHVSPRFGSYCSSQCQRYHYDWKRSSEPIARAISSSRCTWCLEAFTVSPYTKSDQFCGRACKAKAHRSETCRIYVKPCAECGAMTTFRTSRGKFCSKACNLSDGARRAREDYAADPERHRNRVKASRAKAARPCTRCGGPTAVPEATVCGPCQRKNIGDARPIASLRRRWQAWQEDAGRSAPRLPPAPPPGPTRRQRLQQAAEARTVPARPTLAAGRCAICRTPFVALQKWARYCSPECRAKRVPGQTKRAARFAIYDRDGWRCGLCSLPVPMVVRHPHPLSPSLDHIVPRSHGGHDGPDNLRLTHLWCNSARGDESNPEWVDKILQAALQT